MKVTMVLVSSLNGKITRDGDTNISLWTSKEDAKVFLLLRDKHKLIIMGRKTYTSIHNKIKLQPNKLRVVLTKNPAKYSNYAKKGLLEFTNDNPTKLLKRLESKGYKSCLLVGGSEITTLFLQSLLIDEIYLTIEPKIFGKGKSMLAEDNFEAQLKLISVKKLNSQGTLLLKYNVQK